MLSKELAQLSSVTVRTLRYYHQIGVLPEPPRNKNGYRQYEVVDLARVLRIKRLASLGLSLDQIRTIVVEEALGGTKAPEETARLLDDIETEIETQIAILEERRRTISLLKQEVVEGESVLEASASIRRHVSNMIKLGANEKTAIAELHQLLLVDGSKNGSTMLDDILGLYRLMEERGVMARYISLINEAQALPCDVGEKECSELAKRVAELLSPVVTEYLENSDHDEDWDDADPRLERLIRSYDAKTLTPSQAKLSLTAEERIREMVEGLIATKKDSDT